jgi:hypothetical protein
MTTEAITTTARSNVRHLLRYFEQHELEDVFTEAIEDAVKAEREYIYHAIETQARALDTELLGAAGTPEWPKLASRMNGLQTAADLVFNRARQLGTPIKR